MNVYIRFYYLCKSYFIRNSIGSVEIFGMIISVVILFIVVGTWLLFFRKSKTRCIGKYFFCVIWMILYVHFKRDWNARCSFSVLYSCELMAVRYLILFNNKINVFYSRYATLKLQERIAVDILSKCHFSLKEERFLF